MTERTKRVTTFLNEEETTLLEKQCADMGMSQSAYLRSLITSGNPAGSKVGYTELLQHIADLDGVVFAIAEAAKENPALQQGDVEQIIDTMDAIWEKVKGCL